MSAPASPAAMEGGGAYNRHSAVQASGLRGALDLWQAAAEAVPLGAGPVTLADYGAAAGRNSLGPMSLALSILRRRMGADVPIGVVHVDVPANDFTALFETLEQDSGSYLRGDPLVFPSAVGRSFFGSVLPPASVLLGWSSWAVHWLSRAPMAVPDHILAECSADPSVRAEFAAQAAQDWRRFLACRAVELQPGGRLVVMTIASNGDGPAYVPVLDAIHGGLRDLVATGELTAVEADAMVVPTVTRDAQAYAAPFSGADGVAGLRLLDLDVFAGEDPVWPGYERDRDAGAWASQWVSFMRAAAFPSLAQALADRSPARRQRFFEALQARATARLAAAPAPMPVWFARMMIEKVLPAAP